MKRYSASDLRQNLARVLDEVEQGEDVVVERRGRRFRLVAEKAPQPVSGKRAFFRLRDRALLDTGWTWTWDGPARPLRLTSRKKPGRS